MIGRALGAVMALVTFAFVWSVVVRSSPTVGVWIGWLPAAVMAVIAGILTIAFWGAVATIVVLTGLLTFACRPAKPSSIGGPKAHRIASGGRSAPLAAE